MRFLSSFAALAFALSAPVAIAADAPPVMKPSLVRGTVDSFDGKALVLKTDAGASVSLPVSAATHYAAVVKKSFSQLKPTDFIGVTAVPGKDGHLRAEEIHTIPLHGLGEGQYPWDHHPSTAASGSMMAGSMTNGTVATSHVAAPSSMTNGTVTSTGGTGQLKVTYRGAEMIDGKCEGLATQDKPGCTGAATVDVPPATPIVAIVPGLHEDLKPGISVVAQIFTDPAGHQTVASVTMEKNGVKPEF